MNDRAISKREDFTLTKISYLQVSSNDLLVIFINSEWFGNKLPEHNRLIIKSFANMGFFTVLCSITICSIDIFRVKYLQLQKSV